MKTPLELRLYASGCARNDFYLDRIRQSAQELGLHFTAEKIVDEDLIAAQGFESACQPAYCPGCRANRTLYPKEDASDIRLLPVLTANGVPLFWDVPPSDQALRAALAKYLP